jgi:hypothetical protein
VPCSGLLCGASGHFFKEIARSDPLGYRADLLRRFDPDRFWRPPPDLSPYVVPDRLIGPPPIDLPNPIPLPPSDAELAARAEAAAAAEELADQERMLELIAEYLKALREWSREIIFYLGDHIIARATVRVFDRVPGSASAEPTPPAPPQYVNAPVEPWVHEYWNNLQRQGSGNRSDPSAGGRESAPNADGNGGGSGAQPALDSVQPAAPSSAPAPTPPEPVSAANAPDRGAAPPTSGRVPAGSPMPAPVAAPTDEPLKAPDEVVAHTPSITVSLPPLDATNPDVGGTVYDTDTLTGDTRSAPIVGGSANGGYYIGDPGTPGYVGRALVTQIVPPPLGIDDPPITDPLDNAAAAVGSGIRSAISSPFGQRLLGGLEAVGGVAEGAAGSALFAAGAVAEGTLFGIPAGLLLQGAGLAALANAGDHILTGTRQAISGTPQQTVAAQIAGEIATRTGASPGTVQAVQNAVQLGQGIAGIGTFAGARHVGTSPPQPIVLPSESGVAPSTISPSELGDYLGSGGNKDVYAYGDRQAVGLLKQGKAPRLITDELGLLKQLDELGLPTVNASGPISVDGQAGMLMDRFAQGSKDIVRTIDGKVTVVGNSTLLNDQSIADLQEIRQVMVDKGVKIDDLQFLIRKDGGAVIADPLKVFTGVRPSPVNLKTIDLLIQQAKINGGS